MQGVATDLAFKHEAQHSVLNSRVGLAVLVHHQDNRRVEVCAKFLVGQIGYVPGAVVQLGEVGYRDIPEIFGGAIEVARGVRGQISG